MTVEEFVWQYKKESPLEIIDGKIVSSMPMVSGQSYAAQNIYQALFDYEEKGEIFFRLPFVILNQDGSIRDVRLTEISWTHKERWISYKADTPDWGDKPMMIVPDLAINVLPYDGSVLDTDSKFERDLQLGVQMVWIVDPNHKNVTVLQLGIRKKLLIEDMLIGGDVIPGFVMPVSAIFE